jgi:IclR family KDG regulon transcriptional repressor
MKAESSDRSLITRICAVLNAFNEENRVITLTEISRSIGLPKSTTHRLLGTLEAQNILYRDPDGLGYHLGYQLIHWGMLAQRGLDIRNIALPVLRSLSDFTQETAVLSIRYGTAGIWIEQIETRHPVRLAMRVGQRLLLHAGASSKVLLAFLPQEDIERIVPQLELNPIRPKTITNSDMLYRELKAIRERGYATSFEETDVGVMGIAAPVYDYSGRAIAGIGIVAPIVRIPPEKVSEVAPMVLDASYELSRILGARNSPSSV